MVPDEAYGGASPHPTPSPLQTCRWEGLAQAPPSPHPPKAVLKPPDKRTPPCLSLNSPDRLLVSAMRRPVPKGLPYFRLEYDKREDKVAYANFLNELRDEKDGKTSPQVKSHRP